MFTVVGSKCESKPDEDLSIVLGESERTLRHGDSINHDSLTSAYNNFNEGIRFNEQKARLKSQSTIKAPHSNSILKIISTTSPSKENEGHITNVKRSKTNLASNYFP